MTEILNIPQDTDLERVVLGVLILEPEHLPEVVNILTAESFYDEFNGRVYRTMCSMYDANEAIDLYTLCQRCRQQKGMGEDALYRLSSLTQLVASGANFTAHVAAIKEKQLARQLILSASKAVGQIQGGSLCVSEVLDSLNGDIDKIAMQATGSKARHIGSILKDSLHLAEQRQILASSGQTPGITTGLAKLDQLTTGWQPSELIILAGRPAMGKTALMLHFAKSAATAGSAVCIYSLEMSATSLADRLLLSESDVASQAYRSGKMNREEWRDIELATERLSGLPIYVDDNPVVSMRYIRTHAKTMHKRGKCDMIFIDYLQLAEMSSGKYNREQEVAQVSRQAKIIAKELNVPVVLLSQLSRKCEERGGENKMPMLSDLRESGAIEQDADVVGFIFRPAYYKIENWNTSNGQVSTSDLGIINIAKQRNGATKEIPFRYNDSLTRITDYTLYDNAPKTAESPF